MANVNKVILIGNLTRDPELRHTTKGTAVADISLAVNRVTKDANGERREETTYVDVTLWGKTAEFSEKYLSKGRSVYLEGRLHLDTWDDKTTGQKRSKLKVIGENLQFIGSNGESRSRQPSAQAATQDQDKQLDGQTAGSNDIPF